MNNAEWKIKLFNEEKEDIIKRIYDWKTPANVVDRLTLRIQVINENIKKLESEL